MSGKKATIIGAGQTGRGFIAPFLESSEYEYCFIDKNKSLIDSLKKVPHYKIDYYADDLPKKIIENKFYYDSDSPEAVRSISNSDLVITAVGKDNIKDLIPLFKRAIEARKKKDKLSILLCENGVNVKEPLIQAGIDAYVSEGVIFATTLKQKDDSLDLLSENYPNIPYDVNVEGLDVNIDGFIPEENFSYLIQRKIYTYNCLSAVIAYAGYYKEYDLLGDAANDIDIDYLIEKIVNSLNVAISNEFSIDIQEQRNFSKLAINKFKNKDIIDTIKRNTRDSARKIGSSERLIKPLRLFIKYKQSIEYLALIIAATLYYGKIEEKLENNSLSKISKISDLPIIQKSIYEIYSLFEKKIDLKNIINLVEQEYGDK